MDIIAKFSFNKSQFKLACKKGSITTLVVAIIAGSCPVAYSATPDAITEASQHLNATESSDASDATPISADLYLDNLNQIAIEQAEEVANVSELETTTSSKIDAIAESMTEEYFGGELPPNATITQIQQKDDGSVKLAISFDPVLEGALAGGISRQLIYFKKLSKDQLAFSHSRIIQPDGSLFVVNFKSGTMILSKQVNEDGQTVSKHVGEFRIRDTVTGDHAPTQVFVDTMFQTATFVASDRAPAGIINLSRRNTNQWRADLIGPDGSAIRLYFKHSNEKTTLYKAVLPGNGFFDFRVAYKSDPSRFSYWNGERQVQVAHNQDMHTLDQFDTSKLVFKHIGEGEMKLDYKSNPYFINVTVQVAEGGTDPTTTVHDLIVKNGQIVEQNDINSSGVVTRQIRFDYSGDVPQITFALPNGSGGYQDVAKGAYYGYLGSDGFGQLGGLGYKAHLALDLFGGDFPADAFLAFGSSRSMSVLVPDSENDGSYLSVAGILLGKIRGDDGNNIPGLQIIKVTYESMVDGQAISINHRVWSDQRFRLDVNPIGSSSAVSGTILYDRSIAKTRSNIAIGALIIQRASDLGIDLNSLLITQVAQSASSNLYSVELRNDTGKIIELEIDLTKGTVIEREPLTVL